MRHILTYMWYVYCIYQTKPSFVILYMRHILTYMWYVYCISQTKLLKAGVVMEAMLPERMETFVNHMMMCHALGEKGFIGMVGNAAAGAMWTAEDLNGRLKKSTAATHGITLSVANEWTRMMAVRIAEYTLDMVEFPAYMLPGVDIWLSAGTRVGINNAATVRDFDMAMDRRMLNRLHALWQSIFSRGSYFTRVADMENRARDHNQIVIDGTTFRYVCM
jgi:hypothetical protein